METLPVTGEINLKIEKILMMLKTSRTAASTSASATTSASSASSASSSEASAAISAAPASSALIAAGPSSPPDLCLPRDCERDQPRQQQRLEHLEQVNGAQ